MVHAVRNRIDDLVDLLLRLRQFQVPDITLRTPFAVEAVCFFRIGSHGLGGHFRRHHSILEAGKHTALQLFSLDRAIVRARAVADMVRAGKTISTAQRVGTAAAPADDETGQERFRSSGTIQSVLLVMFAHGFGQVRMLVSDFALTRLRGLPEHIIDNAQLGYLGGNPFGIRIETRDTLPRRRVLHIPLAVPDQSADIELVIHNSRAALHVAADGGVVPEFALGAADLLVIERLGDGPRADAGGKFPKDAADDICLIWVDLAVASDRFAVRVEFLDHAVAVAKTTARFAIFDAAAHAAMGLGREILEEQGVHRTLKADMQFADLALSQRHDGNASKLEMLEQCRNVGLVTRDAIQRLRQNNVELARLCILKKRLDTRSQDHAGARNARILVGADHLPLLALRLLPANAELVLD